MRDDIIDQLRALARSQAERLHHPVEVFVVSAAAAEIEELRHSLVTCRAMRAEYTDEIARLRRVLKAEPGRTTRPALRGCGIYSAWGLETRLLVGSDGDG